MVDEKHLAKVVWIIGSGFSVGLGGPLLKDLLHPRTEKDFKSRFPGIHGEHRSVLNFFMRHHPQYRADWNKDHPLLWTHAEEFLDFIDRACSPGSSYARRYGVYLDSQITPEKMRKAACQIVSTECQFFDPAPDIGGEAWQPYFRWASKLTQFDTIITFNYDLVLEALAQSSWLFNHHKDGLGKQRLSIDSFYVPGFNTPPDHVAKVYKLHGSVDWIEGPEGGIQRRDATEIIQRDELPLIATPGPTKDVHATGRLQSTWNKALDALREANVIVFMGYRFPPSDSESRRKLLEAVGDTESRYLRVQTVLGPRKNEDDTVRLSALLEATVTTKREEYDAFVRGCVPGYAPATPFADSARPNYHLKVHPLYVQDYLTVLNEKMLIGPHLVRRL